MRRRKPIREYVPVGRVSLLLIALGCALAAWLLFHLEAPGIVTLFVSLVAVGQVLLAVLALPPGRAYSFASRQDARHPGDGASTARRNASDPPVSRVNVAVRGGLIGAIAGLVHWLGGPREIVWILAACAAMYLVVMLLPERIRRLLAWDLGDW